MSKVLIGRALLNEIPETLHGSKKVLIVYPQPLAATADVLAENLKSAGIQTYMAEVPAAEDAKRVEVAAFCWQIMGQGEFNRNDAVIGLGGGSTTDLAGFVAATWLRGIRSVLIPTTLLGMVDAAIGGKTGINTSEGKNLVGAFHLPDSVVIDLDTLSSLPRNELLAGMAEVVKYGFIAAPEILEIIESDESATDPTSEAFERMIRESVRIKTDVTSRDFKESGDREFLNYGHTLGHAIEHAERYKWRHGAAISIGMVFAAELSMLSGKLSEAEVSRHRSIFEGLGLPITYRADRWPQLLDTMQRDKKARGGALRFVVLDRIGKPSILSAPTPELLFTAFQSIVE
ncbi:MAG: 3-dehydroquinate synthase [Micrococcales bacterium]|nr:3-dehydroquinate synthase [Micrococcales bacterium]MBT5430806.1 3-dehydroquinate synthase [Micrococcales bacterium]MBT5848148.1 3-dehydroquinate synthase [Micrococcales bacterium]